MREKRENPIKTVKALDSENKVHWVSVRTTIKELCLNNGSVFHSVVYNYLFCYLPWVQILQLSYHQGSFIFFNMHDFYSSI